MPIGDGKCAMFPYLGRGNKHCVPRCEVPDDMIRMRCDPYIRMVQVPVKAPKAKKCENPCAPKDSLDLALTACYDHHRQWWAPRNATRMQCETYRLFPYGRCQARLCRLQNLPDDPCAVQCCYESTPLQLSVSSEPCRSSSDNSHLDCSIASPNVSSLGSSAYGLSTDDSYFSGC